MLNWFLVNRYIKTYLNSWVAGELKVGELFKGDFSSTFGYIPITINSMQNLKTYKIKLDEIFYKKVF